MIAHWNGKQLLAEQLNAPPNHVNRVYVTLWIFDYHGGEYPLPDSKQPWPGWKAEVIYSYSNLSGLVGEELADQVDEAIVEMFSKASPGHGDRCGDLWSVCGTYGEVRDCFVEFAADVMGGPVGADDDTYDYWPNAFGMAQQMAEDLDKLWPEGKCDELLHKMYDTMIAERGHVSEFSDPWTNQDPVEDDDKLYNQTYGNAEWKGEADHDVRWAAYTERIKQLQERMRQIAAAWEVSQ